MYIRPNDNLFVQNRFKRVYQGTLLSQQKLGNLGVYLQRNVGSHHLAGLPTHIVIDIVANRAPRLKITLPLTVKAWFTQHAVEGFTGPLSRHFN